MITRVTGELQVARALEVCAFTCFAFFFAFIAHRMSSKERDCFSLLECTNTSETCNKIFATKFLSKKYLTTVFIYSFASSQFSFGCLLLVVLFVLKARGCQTLGKLVARPSYRYPGAIDL